MRSVGNRSPWHLHVPPVQAVIPRTPDLLGRKHRVDPAATGLGQGLQLVAKDVNHPMQRSSFEHRYGFGCGNRLSAACISICETGSYVPPTAYDE